MEHPITHSKGDFLLFTACNVRLGDYRGVTQIKYIMNITELIRNNQTDQLKEAIKANPEIVNQPDERGFTPLILATYLNQKEIAEVLIEEGANINYQDKMVGNTALMGVCFKGSAELAKMLLEKGANVSLKNSKGETALDFAKNGGYEEIVGMLASKV